METFCEYGVLLRELHDAEQICEVSHSLFRVWNFWHSTLLDLPYRFTQFKYYKDNFSIVLKLQMQVLYILLWPIIICVFRKNVKIFCLFFDFTIVSR